MNLRAKVQFEAGCRGESLIKKAADKIIDRQPTNWANDSHELYLDSFPLWKELKAPNQRLVTFAENCFEKCPSQFIPRGGKEDSVVVDHKYRGAIFLAVLAVAQITIATINVVRTTIIGKWRLNE